MVTKRRAKKTEKAAARAACGRRGRRGRGGKGGVGTWWLAFGGLTFALLGLVWLLGIFGGAGGPGAAARRATALQDDAAAELARDSAAGYAARFPPGSAARVGAACGDDALLDGWLNDDFALPGYHVLCVVPEFDSDAGAVQLHLPTIYTQGLRKNKQASEPIALQLDAPAGGDAWMAAFRAGVERAAAMRGRTDADLHARRAEALARRRAGPTVVNQFDPKRYFPQRWRVFGAASGRPVRSVASDVLGAFGDGKGGKPTPPTAPLLLLVFEGGQWIWPGVRLGYRRPVSLPGREGVPIVMETASLQPLVLSTEDLLASDECDHIIERALPHMKASSVSFMDHDVGKPATQFRTSTTYFMPSATATIKALDARVANLTRTRVHQQEYVQVLRYEKGQRYGAHLDYWDPQYYQSDPRFLDQIHGGHHNRLATVLWYMSDVEAGGETNFPRANVADPTRMLPHPSVTQDCDQDLGPGVKRTGYFSAPKRGMVTVFYSLKPDGSFDKSSLHSACAVAGDRAKWAANKWIHNFPEGHLMRDDPLPGFLLADPTTWDSSVLGHAVPTAVLKYGGRPDTEYGVRKE